MITYSKPYFSYLLVVNLIVIGIFGTAAEVQAQRAYQLKEGQFYRSFKKELPSSESRIVHFPAELDEKMKTEFFYQGREEMFLPLLDSLNLFMNSLAWSKEARGSIAIKGAPYLFVGSSEAESAPPATMMMRSEEELYPPMALYLEKPSRQWKGSLRQLIDENAGDYALLVWVGLTEYPKGNKGVFKKKVVLGTGYEREIRLLSAVDKPVEVLQLTGVLLDRNGEIVRAGAEGFLHEDSPFWVQALDAGTTVSDNMVKTLFTEQTREDLPGNPAAWKVAATNLLEQLTRQSRYN